MGHVTGVKFFLISQSPFQISLHYQDRSMSLGPVSSIFGSEGFFGRDFEISKKNLHPWDVPYGGMFLEVKNPKNRTPKVILHPNTIFKSHQFVVMFLIHLYIHSSRQTIGPRDTSVRDITKNWWILKKNFGWKTTFRFRFFGFFTFRIIYSIWTYAGCKNISAYLWWII